MSLLAIEIEALWRSQQRAPTPLTHEQLWGTPLNQESIAEREGGEDAEKRTTRK